MLQSKIFANGSTTLPKSVRETLGVNAGDSVRYVISDNSVQIVKASHSLKRLLVIVGLELL